VVEELGEAPLGFSDYGGRVLDFALANDFSYSYQPWPAGRTAAEHASSPD
jgi:hypothetical protein